MLRHELTTSVLRFYHREDAGYCDPHDVICQVTWLNQRVVILWGHTGKHTRKSLRELLRWLVDTGIERVLAERGAGHGLPGSEDGPMPGWCQVDVAKLAQRISPTGQSTASP